MKTHGSAGLKLFVLGILLGGAAHVADRLLIRSLVIRGETAPGSALLYGSTLLFCLNLAIYFFLILWWATSVRERLLQSRERRYLLASTVFMMFLLCERTVKYRIAGANDTLTEFLWYAYYPPVLMLPTLLLMVALRMEARTGRRRMDERLLLIPAAVLSVLFLTNRWHRLIFRPLPGQPLLGYESQYAYGLLYYLYYAYVLGTAAFSLVLLTKTNLRLSGRRRAAGPFVVLLAAVVVFFVQRLLHKAFGNVIEAFNFPELFVFCAIGLYESCLQSRLIPHNENYAGFFASMRQPAVITDGRFSTVYSTAEPVSCPAETMRSALEAAVEREDGLYLHGSRVGAVYIFWTEDESELRRMNARLEDANELLDTENTLIRAETELAAERAQVSSRNRIYAQIAERTYPQQKRIEALIEAADPGGPGFRDTMARVCVLNAYIKRAANMMLTDEGAPSIDRRELQLALAETGRYLAYLGVLLNAAEPEPGTVGRDTALSLYASFEALCEAMLPRVTQINAALDGNDLRLAADAAIDPPLPQTELPVRMWESEGVWYYAVGAAEGGAS